MNAQVWVAAARPRTLPAAVAPVLLGAAFAWHDGSFSMGASSLCLAFALLVQIGTNFANDYYDFVKGADTAARVGPRRAVAAGLVAPKTMFRAMASVFTVSFLVGLGLLPWGGWPLLVIGVASIFCGFAYTGGPWPLGYLGLGDVFVFLFFGLVAVCTTYFVQTHTVTTEVAWAATAIGALAANILVVNNYRDVETDAVAGKRTLAVRFGRGFARVQFSLSLLAAFTVPILLLTRGHRAWILLPLALAPVAWSHVRRLRESKTAGELISLLGDTGKLLALYALLFAAGLALERVA
ncbi:MAG: 1,4-dihydroxy-2-naphthoate polyprenyltransferase [Opitutaceae bacterium]